MSKWRHYGRGVWKVSHLGAVNTGLPTGENALQYAWSLSLNIICASAQYVGGTAWAGGTSDRCVLARLPRAQIVSGYCIHMRIEAIFKNGTNSLENVIPSLNSAQQDKPADSLSEPWLMEKCPPGRTVMSGPVRNHL